MNANQARLEMFKLFGERAAVAIARDDDDPSVSYYLVGRCRLAKGPIIGWKKKSKIKFPSWESKYEQINRKDFIIDVYGWGKSWQEAIADALLEVMSNMGRVEFHAYRSKAYCRPVLKVDLSKNVIGQTPNKRNFQRHKELHASAQPVPV